MSINKTYFDAVSKKKFAQLARVFTRSRKRGSSGLGSSSSSGSAKSILSQGPAPSHDSMMLNSEPLIEEDDEDDELEQDTHGEVDLHSRDRRDTHLDRL
jgi:hypothetical protein